MPFNFSEKMKALCTDICQRLPELTHIRMEQVAVTFTQARRKVTYGLQAKVTPMRFKGGSLTDTRDGRNWTIQRLFQADDDVEIFYIITFYLPRFLNHCFREKMITVMHELYHISPQFNGDIRRLPGHHHVHSSSQVKFDLQMEGLVDAYLALSPPSTLYDFLQLSHGELHRRFGGVEGIKVPIPKLIPLRRVEELPVCEASR